MKTGRTLTQLAQEVDRQRTSRRDFLAPTEKLTMMNIPIDNRPMLLGLTGDDPMELTPFAPHQLAEDLGIPGRYYDRMKAEAPGLLAENVNAWLRKEPRRRMVRTLDGQVRAWLSDRYRPIDNFDLLEAILPSLGKMNVDVASVELTETRMHLKIIMPSISMDLAMARREAMMKAGIELHTERPGEDVVQAAVTISNSEVGVGALTVDESIHRLICYNLATVCRAVRKYHVGKRHGNGNGDDGFNESVQAVLSTEARVADDRAFFLKVRDVVKASLTWTRFEANALKLAGAAGDKITRPVEELGVVLMENFGLSDLTRKSIVQRLAEGGDLTRYGLINAVTLASQDEADYDTATDLERLGGTILELPSGQWTALAA